MEKLEFLKANDVREEFQKTNEEEVEKIKELENQKNILMENIADYDDQSKINETTNKIIKIEDEIKTKKQTHLNRLLNSN